MITLFDKFQLIFIETLKIKQKKASLRNSRIKNLETIHFLNSWKLQITGS